MQVKYLQCNNAGENVSLKKTCQQEGLRVEFKYTAPGVSQQNGCIKYQVATHFNWVHAMLKVDKLIIFLCNGLMG